MKLVELILIGNEIASILGNCPTIFAANIENKNEVIYCYVIISIFHGFKPDIQHLYRGPSVCSAINPKTLFLNFILPCGSFQHLLFDFENMIFVQLFSLKETSILSLFSRLLIEETYMYDNSMQSEVRLPDGRRLYTASFGIWTK